MLWFYQYRLLNQMLNELSREHKKGHNWRETKLFEIMYKNLAAYRWSENSRIAIRAWKSDSSLSSITAIEATRASGPWLSRVALFKKKRRDQVRHITLSFCLINSTVREAKHAAKVWLFVHSLSPITNALIDFLYTQVYVADDSSGLPLPKGLML